MSMSRTGGQAATAAGMLMGTRPMNYHYYTRSLHSGGSGREGPTRAHGPMGTSTSASATLYNSSSSNSGGGFVGYGNMARRPLSAPRPFCGVARPGTPGGFHDHPLAWGFTNDRKQQTQNSKQCYC
ncbi:unnamed protein product [Calypogeia fissa]